MKIAKKRSAQRHFARGSYEKKIRGHIYSDFLGRYNLEDDVVNEVFDIFLRRADQRNIEDAIVRFPAQLKYFILEAIRAVIEKQQGDIKLKLLITD